MVGVPIAYLRLTNKKAETLSIADSNSLKSFEASITDMHHPFGQEWFEVAADDEVTATSDEFVVSH